MKPPGQQKTCTEYRTIVGLAHEVFTRTLFFLGDKRPELLTFQVPAPLLPLISPSG